MILPDYNPVTYGNANSLPLFTRLMAVARQLPILGNPNGVDIRYLFHFSQNNGISAFNALPMAYCWADAISANIPMVQAITNAAQPATYTSIYILRIGMNANVPLSQSPVVGAHIESKVGTCIEYGLAVPVKSGDFGRVGIKLDPTGVFFLP